MQHSDATIAIAPTYIDHYKKISPKTNYKIIPNNVDVSRFRPDTEFRLKFRSKNNIENNSLLFCYCGSMGSASWHRANIYAQYILKLRKMQMPHHFLGYIRNSQPLNMLNIKPVMRFIRISNERNSVNFCTIFPCAKNSS